MKTVRHPRFSDSVRKAEKILKKLQKGSAPEGIFALCLPKGENHLEILPSVLLRQKYYQGKEGWILGIAMTRSEAEAMAAGMLTEAYRKDLLQDLRASFAEDFR